jgi:hypothetical protein
MEISPEAMIALNRTAFSALRGAASDLGDRITWHPLDRGRSALDQIVECVSVATRFARLLERRGAAPDAGKEDRMSYPESAEQALAALDTAVERLATAITAFPAAAWGNPVHPWGPGTEWTFADLPLRCYWNAVYHEGQINYIQTLLAPS